jgi:uncharacterized protein with GYD domain
MATYLMFGKYTPDALKGASAERTKQAREAIRNLGGEIRSIYALLGNQDLVLLVDVPGIEQAMKASVTLTRLTGIGFSTMPAVEVEDFDKLAADA